MKKMVIRFFVLIACMSCVWVWATKAVSKETLQENEIYVFTQKTCPHCWAVEAYLKEKHPNLKVQLRDISELGNMNLFFVCGEKFNLKKTEMGTPLFCMGKKYIMGWSSEEQKEFEEYVKDFPQK